MTNRSPYWLIPIAACLLLSAFATDYGTIRAYALSLVLLLMALLLVYLGVYYKGRISLGLAEDEGP